jgi:hypothetical protein
MDRGGTILPTQLATAGVPTAEKSRKYPTVKGATSTIMHGKIATREMMNVLMQKVIGV